MSLKETMKKRESTVALAIILMSILIQALSGSFFTVNNFVDITRTAMTQGMMALGVFMVIVSGGFDMSFCSIADLAMYVPMSWMIATKYNGNMILPFLMCIAIGFGCGALNSIIAHLLKIDHFIVTLCTNVIYKGFLLAVLRAKIQTGLPEAALKLSTTPLFVLQNPATGTKTTITVLVLVFVAVILILGFILKYTNLGRGVFAIGGNESAAKVAGFNVFRIHLFIYGTTGMLAGLAAFISTLLLQTVQPTGYSSMSMEVISMVVIGGTSLVGGHGSLGGTLLGILLLTIIKSSLIMIGVPSYFQLVVTGLFILFGSGLSSYSAVKQKRKASQILTESFHTKA